MNRLTIAVFVAALSGCSPLSQETMKAIAEAARDRSSCYMIGGGAGGLSVLPGPGVPAAGGYGYFWSGHAMPGQSVIIAQEGCAILDGGKKPSPVFAPIEKKTEHGFRIVDGVYYYP